MTEPIQTCIFDLGNVLVFFSHDRMVQNVAQVSGVAEADARGFLFDDGYQVALETGRISEDEFHVDFSKRTGARVELARLNHALADIFELNEQMIPLLQDLKQLDMRLVLLSNTCEPHLRFVRQRWKFLSLFDAVTASWEVGAMKPDRRIYASALAQARCAAENCFFTDDIHEYVAQAVALGIQARQFQNAAETRRELRALGVALPELSRPDS